jgi:uncharacterized protein YecE (DUF72 family)
MMVRHQPKVYIGMGGWELYPFNQYFYPPKRKKGFRKLEFYSQFFDSIEVNATFYNTSFTSAHARQWLRDVSSNKEFVFTVKLFRGFTHDFTATQHNVYQILKMVEPLTEEGRMSGFVMQFPYSFAYSSERLKYILRLKKLLEPHRVFVELRHNSWNFFGLFDLFQEVGIHYVNVDIPAMKKHMPFLSYSTNGVAYFRMMGRNREKWNNPWRLEEDGKHVISDRYNYLYTDWEIEHLLYLIEKTKTGTVFVIFHNDPEANSLINGFQLRHLVQNKRKVLVPKNFVDRNPVLKMISASVNVEHPLFSEA